MSSRFSKHKQSIDSRTGEKFLLEEFIQQHPVYVYGLLALLCLAVLTIYFLPALVRFDVYTNDMRQHVAWYYSVPDPELFQNDLLKTYYADTFSPIGYRALYGVVSLLIDPQFFGELMAFVLATTVIFLAYAIGKTVTGGMHLGGIAGILFVLFNHALKITELMPTLAGGLQRSFGVPIMLLGVLAILRRDLRVLSLAILLGALFYPPVLINLVMISGLAIGFWLWRQQISWRSSAKGLLLISATVALCLGMLLWVQHNASAGQTWTLYSLQEALIMPEYYPGGIFTSTPIFFEQGWEYVTHALPLSSPSALVLFWIASGIFFWRSPRFRPEVILLLVAGIINYALAYLLLFKLYEPDRYVSYVQFAFWLVIMPVVGLEVMRWAERQCLRLLAQRAIDSETKEFIREFSTLALVAMLILPTASLTYSRIQAGTGGMIGNAPAEVYEYLKTLPKDTKIAADPADSGDIPIRSQRSVLVMAVALIPFHKEFYQEMTARTDAIWAAMYATDSAPILNLSQQYGADVLLVNRQWYEQSSWSFKPLDAVVEQYRQRLGDRTPLVLALPDNAILFKSGSFSVIDLKYPFEAS